MAQLNCFSCLIFIALMSGVILPRVQAQENMFSLNTVHFAVRHQEGVTADDARRVADYLESDYEYLSRKLSIVLQQPVVVMLHGSKGKFLDGTRQARSSRRVIFTHGVLHVGPVKMLDRDKTLERSLSFELAFLMLDSAKGCPRWLREALAVYHSGVMTDLTSPSGMAPKYFSDMDQDIQQYPNPPQRDNVHYWLGMTWRFFLERYGDEKAFSVFRNFDGIRSTGDIFKNVFGEEFDKIERSWAAFLSRGSGVR